MIINNSKSFAEQEGNQGNVGEHKPNENKKSYKFKINGGKPYNWPTPIINEADIRRIGQVPESGGQRAHNRRSVDKSDLQNARIA